MADFKKFQKAVQEQFERMKGHPLFVTGVSKDGLWDTYLKSFPEGTNPIFRERTEHDCQCCRSFIRTVGNVVAIVNNRVVSIWDGCADLEGDEDCYNIVASKLADLVKGKYITDVFRHDVATVGVLTNYDIKDLKIKWNHFQITLPSFTILHKDRIGAALGEMRSNKEVFKRSLDEISGDAIDTVLDLIGQNSLYRGEEHQDIVETLRVHNKVYLKLKGQAAKDNYCWIQSLNLRGAAKIRNTVIGTLLVDISDGVELDTAVKAFEAKVAPTNYKRPTALVTKAMIEKAEANVLDLGIGDSLHRRFAVAEDLNITNVIWADRSAKKVMGGSVFDEMKSAISVKPKSLDKVEEVDIQTFIDTILPTASSLELLFENSQTNNLVSLIAPEKDDALMTTMFKWGNNYSWSYNGEVADSIKERVKNAGGNVEGVLRCSLSWENKDDLDIHCIEPNGNHICYRMKSSPYTSGQLDVDMNISNPVKGAVENITWADKNKMGEGNYQIMVHNFTQREKTDVGFTVEIEYDGVINTFHYAKEVKGQVDVATFSFTKKDGLKIITSIPSSQASKEVWGISTSQYHKVSMVMNSPNHWDGEQTGNKHYFFMLEGCKNDKDARGFYNEFLNNNLTEHRKVFEILGSKLKAKVTDNQLSGLGFSSTGKGHVFCKVTGSFTRTIKITF